MSRVCIVVPAYNEEKRIGEVLSGTDGLGLEVLVVDDGSSDGTARVARAHSCHLLSHEKNQGKGAAIRTAIPWILERGFDAAVFLDADGQHLATEVTRFVEEFERSGADLIVGTRMHENSAMPLVRKFSNRISSGLVSLLAGTRVTDSQSGFRLLSARLLRRIASSGGKGFDLESEMIIDAVRGGMRYAEVPISCIYKDEKSHYRPVRDSAQFLALVVRKAFTSVMRR